MFAYYSDSTIKSLKKSNKFYIILDVSIFVIFAILFALSLIFVNDQNLVILKILCSIVLSFALCFIFCTIRNIIFANCQHIKHIQKICKSDDVQTVTGTAISKETDICVENQIICDGICLDINKKQINLYLNKKSKQDFPLNVKVKVHYWNRYIVGIEIDE